MLNSISVDVEEYFHASNIEDAIGRSRWASLPSRVEHSTYQVLEVFSKYQIQATFFILGFVARRHPQLIRDIDAEGHEIASHGFRHRLVYQQTPHAFRRDILASKKLLEDLSGKKVLGYRAPNFSIIPGYEWAYDELIRCGYRYDSSTYPTWHPRYANPEASRRAYIIERPEGRLFEFPLAVAELRNVRFPVAGGAYWRLLPKVYCSWGLNKINKEDKMPAHCYLHPWELDPGQPRFEQLSFLRKLRHYGFASQFSKTLEYYCRRFEFGTIRAIAEQTFDSFRESSA